MIKGNNIIPAKGERALIVGQTGGGKTAFACWVVIRIPFAPVLIYDTKIEPKFTKLPNSITVTNMNEAKAEYDNPEVDYIVIRPPVEILDEPEELDKFLLFHYHNFHNSTAYIDEAYTFHKGGRAGKGLVALFTRGRSRGITTIISTQRPRYIDRFTITEAQKIYVFRLADRDDRKRIADIIPNFDDYPLPPKYGFYYYETGEDNPILFKPIKLDPALDTGYTDELVENEDHPIVTENDNASKHVWI